MLRTIALISFLLTSCFAVHAADEASPKSPVSVLLESETKQEGSSKSPGIETLGVEKSTTMSPAVHVNVNGVEYGSGEAVNTTVNKLRSARDRAMLPSTKATDKVESTVKNGQKKTNAAIESFLGQSSRRRKPAKVYPKAPATGANKVDSRPLTSVMTPAQPKAPTLADPTKKPSNSGNPVPTLAVKPADPQLAEPKLDNAASAVRSAASNFHSPALTTSDVAAARTAVDVPAASNPLPKQQDVAQRPELVAELPASGVPSTPLSSPIQLNPGIPFSDINIGSTTMSPAVTTIAPPAKSGFRKVESTPAFGFDAPSSTARKPADTMKLAESTSAFSDPEPEKVNNPTRSPRPRRNSSSDDQPVLLSNRSPVLVVKTHGQKTIRVGRPASYYITAANAGDLAAKDVVVSVNVPNWAELTRNHASTGLVRIEPNSNGDNIMRWAIRNLAPKSEQRLRIDLIPRASRPIELGVTWNFKSVSAMAQIQVQEAKLQLAVVGPSDILFGDTKLYTITVSNPGTGEAENVSLTLLPINDGSGVPSTRELGNLKPGARRTIEVELTARQAGDLAVRAKATADGNLHDEAKQDVRVRRANLVVEAIGPAKKYAGTPARYSVKVTNRGDATAHDVQLAASLPMAAEYVKSSNAGTYEEDRGRVRWAIGALRPGAFQVVDVTTVLTGAGSNKLDVMAIGANKLSASADAITMVESRADLKLSVEDPAGVVSPGTEMTYEVHIVNRGTKAAANVKLVGFFSEGIEPIAIRGWRGNVDVGQVTLQPIPQIAPGQEIIMKVIAKASRPGNHVFRAELSTKKPLTKLAVEEWTVFHSDEEGTDAESAPIQKADNSSDGFSPR